MVEENFGPLAELVSSLVEVRSLVETSCPLNEIVSLGLVLCHTELSVVKLLFPSFHLAETE